MDLTREARRPSRGRGAWLLMLLVAGCGAPGEEREAATPVRPADRPTGKVERSTPDEPIIRSRVSRSPLPFRLGEDDVVAEVGGETIRKSDVYDYFYLFEQPGLLRALQQLVDERLVRREAEHWEVRLDEVLLARAVDKQLAELETRVRVETGGRMTVESYLEEIRNLTVVEYRSYTRRVLGTELLLDRLVRFEQLREDRARARILAVRDRSQAQRFREEVLQGADFERLAKEHSVHPTAPQGGRLPTIVRGLPDPLVASVFALEPNETGPIEQIDLDGERLHYFVQLLEIETGRAGSFPELEVEVERSLETEPIAEHEYLYWRQRAGERYDIDLKF